jgi:uncharacterized protein (DUF2147 family)
MGGKTGASPVLAPLLAVTVLAVLLVMATGQAVAQAADDAFGIWQHPENGSNIEIYRCGDGLCARILRTTDTQKTDDKNPDVSKRKVPVIGLVIISGAKKTAVDTWAGSLYNRADGGMYAGKITVKSKDAIELSGCTAVVICKSVIWRRVRK